MERAQTANELAENMVADEVLMGWSSTLAETQRRPNSLGLLPLAFIPFPQSTCRWTNGPSNLIPVESGFGGIRTNHFRSEGILIQILSQFEGIESDSNKKTNGKLHLFLSYKRFLCRHGHALIGNNAKKSWHSMLVMKLWAMPSWASRAISCRPLPSPTPQRKSKSQISSGDQHNN